MTAELLIAVCDEHTDELGHLNNVQAVEFLQRGRLDLYARCGLRSAHGVDRYGTVVVNLNVNFRRECFLGEVLKVTTGLLSLGTKSFKVEQRIVRADGTVAVDAIVTSVVMEMQSRQVTVIPPAFARYFPSPLAGG